MPQFTYPPSAILGTGSPSDGDVVTWGSGVAGWATRSGGASSSGTGLQKGDGAGGLAAFGSISGSDLTLPGSVTAGGKGTFGLAQVSSWQADASYAFFGQSAHNNSTDAAVLQSSAGETFIGSAPGYPVHIRTANVDRVVVDNVRAAFSVSVGLANLSSAPSGPSAGDSYFDTGLTKARTFDGTSWQNWW